MNGMAIIALAAALGVDVGWRPADSGGLEYIIQIEPQLVGSLLGGQAIASDVPPALRPVRSLRVRVGRGALPREMPQGSRESAAEESQRGVQPSAATTPKGTAVGWQPIEGGGLEYLIQIEPDALSSLGDGEELLFDLQGAAGEVSSLRITVGTETLPQIAPAAEQGTDGMRQAGGVERFDADTGRTNVARPRTLPEPEPVPPGAEPVPPGADDSSGPSLGDPAAATREDADAETAGAGETTAVRPRTLAEPAPHGAEPVPHGAEPVPHGAEPVPHGAERVPPGADEVPTLSEADQIPTLSDAEATQAADVTDESPQPRQALRPEEKPPGRFVPAKDRRPIAAQDDGRTGEGEADGERGGAAIESTGGNRESGVQQSGDEGNNGIATPSPSAEGADKPEKSAAAPDPWWASRTVTFLGLSGSLGANVYLIWLFWGLRRRYRDLVDQLSVRAAA